MIYLTAIYIYEYCHSVVGNHILKSKIKVSGKYILEWFYFCIHFICDYF